MNMIQVRVKDEEKVGQSETRRKEEGSFRICAYTEASKQTGQTAPPRGDPGAWAGQYLTI